MSGPRRRLVTELTTIRPAPLAYRVALRAMLTMVLAFGVLGALGRLDLALFASFGSFAAVYGGRTPWPGRVRIQARHGLTLSAAVVTGALLSRIDGSGWWVLIGAAVWGGWAAAWSDRQSWVPPGSMFCVFAVSGSGSVLATASGSLAVSAVLVAVLTSVLAVTLGAWEARIDPRRYAPPPPRPRPSTGQGVRQAVLCAAAVAGAGTIAQVWGVSHPYWAMMAAVVPLAAFSLTSQVARGLHRAAGTAAGLGVAALLLVWPVPTLVTVTMAVVLQGLTELVVARNYGLAMIFITPLALLLGNLAHPQPVAQLLSARLLETVIGVGVALLLAGINRLIPAPTRPTGGQRGTLS